MPPTLVADNILSSEFETWYHLELSRKQRIRFVLDASDIGLKCQNRALQLIHLLCNQLPRFSQHSVTFLGSKSVYDFGLLGTDAADWFADNNLRLSTITPVYELAEKDIHFVVLAASPLFDLEDWKDTPEFNRTIFFNLGTDSITGGYAKEISPETDRATELVQSLLKSVVIEADHTFPVYWDNIDYTMDENFALQSQAAETFSVTFALVGPATTVRARCTHENGKQDLLEVRSIKPQWPIESWTLLTERAEAEVAHACITKGEFTCPRCKKVHQKSQPVCMLPGQFLKTSVFSSIFSDSACQFALLRAGDHETISFSRIQNPVIALDGNVVAIIHEGQPKLVEFDSFTKTWCLSERSFEQFSFVERWGAYAIFQR